MDRRHVIEAVRKLVHHQDPPGGLLPTDRQLADRWGVSVRTVVRAMKVLAEEGVVVRVRGKGTFAAPAAEQPPGSAQRETAVDGLAESIKREIVSGRLIDREPLPAVKYLCRQFHASATTVSAAYRQLAREGIVSRVGRTYFVGQFAELVRGNRSGSVVVYRFPDEKGLRDLASRSFGTTFHRMEDLLARRGYRVHYRPWEQLESDTRLWTPDRMPRGLVLSSVQSGDYRRIRGVLRRVRRRHEPDRLPILCDYSGTSIPRTQGLMTVMAGIGHDLARYLARFIIKKGWRRVTFVIDSGHFRHTGRFSNLWDFLIVRAELKRLAPGISWRMIVVRTTPQPPWDTLGIEFVGSWVARRLRAYGPVSSQALADEIAPVNNLSMGMEEHARSSDVVVFQRDEYAAQGLEWLSDRGLCVPEDIALVSTDDDPRFYHLGLSRVEVDWDGMGVMMAHFLLEPGRVPRGKGGTLPFPVRAIEKRTT